MADTATLKVTTPTDREIHFTRLFNAPRALVWRAMNEPELVKRWLFGPDGWEMTVCEIDLRVGGRYRYQWRNRQGTVMGMGGVYKEVTAPSRIVTSEKFDDPWYPGESENIIELKEQGPSQTLLAMTCRYESKEARDIAAQSGMETGMALGYDRLEAILATL